MEYDGEALVAYLDIMGYKELVESKQDASKIAKWLNNILDQATKQPIHDDENIQKITDRVNIRIFSDTIMYVLTLNYEQETYEGAHYYAFFSQICSFCSMFIGLVGVLLRGGIAKGHYYENDSDKKGRLFVYSNALIDAYKLESQTAKYPRIILSDKLKEEIESIPFNDKEKLLDKCFFKDGVDSKYSLDFLRWINEAKLYGFDIDKTYDHMFYVLKSHLKKLHRERIQALEINDFDSYKNKMSVLSKWTFFLKYYNSRVKKQFQITKLAD